MPSRNFPFKSTFLNSMPLTIHCTLPLLKSLAFPTSLCLEWRFPKGVVGHLLLTGFATLSIRFASFFCSLSGPAASELRLSPFLWLYANPFGLLPHDLQLFPILLLRPISRSAFSVPCSRTHCHPWAWLPGQMQHEPSLSMECLFTWCGGSCRPLGGTNKAMLL